MSNADDEPTTIEIKPTTEEHGEIIIAFKQIPYVSGKGEGEGTKTSHMYVAEVKKGTAPMFEALFSACPKEPVAGKVQCLGEEFGGDNNRTRIIVGCEDPDELARFLHEHTGVNSVYLKTAMEPLIDEVNKAKGDGGLGTP